MDRSQERVILTHTPKKWHLLVIMYPQFSGVCLKFQMFQSAVLTKSSEFQNIYAKITVPRCLSHTTVPQNLLPENVSCFIYLFFFKSQPTRKSKPRQKARVALFDSSMGTRLFARQMAQSWKMGVMLYSQRIYSHNWEQSTESSLFLLQVFQLETCDYHTVLILEFLQEAVAFFQTQKNLKERMKMFR